jgi:hypothetical protein
MLGLIISFPDERQNSAVRLWRIGGSPGSLSLQHPESTDDGDEEFSQAGMVCHQEESGNQVSVIA